MAGLNSFLTFLGLLSGCPIYNQSVTSGASLARFLWIAAAASVCVRCAILIDVPYHNKPGVEDAAWGSSNNSRIFCALWYDYYFITHNDELTFQWAELSINFVCLPTSLFCELSTRPTTVENQCLDKNVVTFYVIVDLAPNPRIVPWFLRRSLKPNTYMTRCMGTTVTFYPKLPSRVKTPTYYDNLEKLRKLTFRL